MSGGYDYFYTLQEICVLLNLLPNTFRQIVREYSDLIAVREQVRKGRPVLGLPRADFDVLRTIVEMRSQGLSGEEIRAAVARSGGATHAKPVKAGPTVPDRGGPHEDTPGGAPEAGDDGDEPVSVEESPPGGLDEPHEEPSMGRVEPETTDEGTGLRPFPGGDARAEAAAASDGASAASAAGVLAGKPSAAERALLAEIASLREELRKMDDNRREERDRLLTALMRTQRELQSLRYEVAASLSRRDRKKKRGFWAWLLDL